MAASSADAPTGAGSGVAPGAGTDIRGSAWPLSSSGRRSSPSSGTVSPASSFAAAASINVGVSQWSCWLTRCALASDNSATIRPYDPPPRRTRASSPPGANMASAADATNCSMNPCASSGLGPSRSQRAVIIACRSEWAANSVSQSAESPTKTTRGMVSLARIASRRRYPSASACRHSASSTMSANPWSAASRAVMTSNSRSMSSLSNSASGLSRTCEAMVRIDMPASAPRRTCSTRTDRWASSSRMADATVVLPTPGGPVRARKAFPCITPSMSAATVA